MDEDKVETVRNWSKEKKTENGRLNNLFEYNNFWVLPNYYRRFIPKYSEKAETVNQTYEKG